MKLHILFEFKAASGGGNQFLKALRGALRGTGHYAESPAQADAILLNSYQYAAQALAARLRYPEKIFIHRIDGPIRLYNTANDQRDSVTNTLNRLLADGTVFQSQWSRDMNYRLGLAPNRHEITIGNAPAPEMFHAADLRQSAGQAGQWRLIATSWSSNPKKGFETYRWLDRHLDVARYPMTFIGNAPLRFERIVQKPALASAELALELKNHDIFITASQSDPCSNSLIEALHCGLPAVALRDGGHPELIGAGGLTFERPEQIPERLAELTRDYQRYRAAIVVPTLAEIAERYLAFAEQIDQARRRDGYAVKPAGLLTRTHLAWVTARWRALDALQRKLGGPA